MMFDEKKAIADMKEFFEGNENARSFMQHRWRNLLAEVQMSAELGEVDFATNAVRDIVSELQKVGL